MNAHYKNRYYKFIEHIKNLGVRNLNEYTEVHHILPKCLNGTDDPENLIRLTLPEHFLAHWLLWKMYPNYLPIASAFLQMNNKNPNLEYKTFQGRINSRTYKKLKTDVYDQLKQYTTNKVRIRDANGNIITMTSEEYANQNVYEFHTTGKLYVFDIIQNKWVYIKSTDYNNDKNQYLTRLSGESPVHIKYNFIDTVTNKLIKITKTDARIKNKEYGFKRLKQIQKHQVSCIDQEGKTFSVSVEEYKLGKYKSILTHKLAGKFTVKDQIDGTTRQITQEEYQVEKERYSTSTKGKVLARDSAGKNVLVSKEDFAAGDYVGQTTGLTTVFDKALGQYRQITQDEFETNRTNFSGPCSGKVNVINKQTGIRSQIPTSDFDKELYSGLGNKAMLFLCRNKLTGKEKNVNIYEWNIVKDYYDIIDIDKFNKANKLK